MDTVTTWATQIQPPPPLHSFLWFIGGFCALILVAAFPAILYYLFRRKKDVE